MLFIFTPCYQSSSRNIPLARAPICFHSHQTVDYCLLTECGVVFWILQRKIGFLLVFFSSHSQLHYAIQEVVPYDSIFLPENVLALRGDETVRKAYRNLKAVIRVSNIMEYIGNEV